MKKMHTGTVRWGDGTPAAGVAVSNGTQWAHTDENGTFRLPSSTRPIWIRRPSGVRCSQWWKLPATHPVDFTCERADQVISALAHMSDTHLSASTGGREDTVELANRFGDGTDCAQGLAVALDAAANSGAQLAFVTGDLTDHGTRVEFEAFTAIVDASPIPVEVIPGNHAHYGHRHNPDSSDRPIGDGFLGTATTWRYEQSMGPRWWSADIGPFHVLALDWFSYAADIDRAEQDAFVAEDLAGTDPHRPLIVLSHDVPSEKILDLLTDAMHPATSISVLSGHWHVVVDRQVGPLRFLSAPPTSFGGFAWSPPSWHLLSVARTGHLLRETATTWPRHATSTAAEVTWQAPPDHTQHGGNLLGFDHDRLAVPTTHAGRAHLTLVDSTTGQTIWSTRLDGDEITSVTGNGTDSMIAVTFSGALSCLDSTTGELRWATNLPRSRHGRVLNAPVITDDGRLIVGTLDHLTGLSMQTGAELWTTRALAPVDTLMTYGRGLASGHVVVLPFSGPYRGLTAVDSGDGTVLWSQTSGPAPTSTLTAVPGTDHAVVMRAESETLECVELATGAMVWRAVVGGKFTTVSAIPTSAGIVVVTGDGTVHVLDTRTGRPLTKSTQLTNGQSDGWGPYRSTGIGVATDPVAVGGQVVVTTVSGDVWVIDPAGDHELVAALGRHVTTRPVPVRNDRLAVLTTDARLDVIACPPRSVSRADGVGATT